MKNTNYKDALISYMQNRYQDNPKFLETNVSHNSLSSQKIFTYIVKDRNNNILGSATGNNKKEVPSPQNKKLFVRVKFVTFTRISKITACWVDHICFKSTAIFAFENLQPLNRINFFNFNGRPSEYLFFLEPDKTIPLNIYLQSKPLSIDTQAKFRWAVRLTLCIGMILLSKTKRKST